MTNRVKRSWAGVLLAGLVMVAGTGSARAAKDAALEFHWSGTLAAGRTIEINGVNGPIEVVSGAGDRVEVRAVKSGKRQDPADVRVEVVPDERGLLVCAVYPGGGNACARGGSQRVRDNDVRVDFHVVVPAGAVVEARTVNGGVRVSGISGFVRATTVNGNCDIETRGGGEASTVNGSVHAKLGRLGAADKLQFRTVNGGLEVVLPDGADAEVEATTVNGSIRSEFPLTTHTGWGPKHVSGRLGNGAGRLELTTVNGPIRLSRPGARTL